MSTLDYKRFANIDPAWTATAASAVANQAVDVDADLPAQEQIWVDRKDDRA